MPGHYGDAGSLQPSRAATGMWICGRRAEGNPVSLWHQAGAPASGLRGTTADVGDEMTAALFLEQLVNGMQLGTMLFLMSAGLTLTFGVMNFLNLTHGSFYMLGAFFTAAMAAWTGNFLLAVILAIICTLLVGALLDLAIFRHLYNRSHLDQVLATFALLLAFNDLVILIWGREPLFVAIPAMLSGAIEISPGNAYRSIGW